MSKQIEINIYHLEKFFSTMFDRQEIWWKRNVLKQTTNLTEDKIFAKYRFCNVYRELDRTSQYLINNIIKREDINNVDKIFPILVYRLFNNVSFFEEVGIPLRKGFDLKKFQESVIKFEKTKPSTNLKAYNINTWASKGMTQGRMCSEIILPSIIDKLNDIIEVLCSSKDYSVEKELIKAMRSVEAIGNFVSHEWFLDICYIPKYSKQSFFIDKDENSWTNAGPGAIKGINHITNSTCKKYNDFIKELRDLSEVYLGEKNFKCIKFDIDKQKYVKTKHNITLHQIEFWLCEYQKYVRVEEGVGKNRELFNIQI